MKPVRSANAGAAAIVIRIVVSTATRTALAPDLPTLAEAGVPGFESTFWFGLYAPAGTPMEVVRRLHARFDNLHWMKLSEVSRYWAAKELTRIERTGGGVSFRAPFACMEFTVRCKGAASAPVLRAGDARTELKEVAAPLKLAPGAWCRDGEHVIACFALPKGASTLQLS